MPSRVRPAEALLVPSVLALALALACGGEAPMGSSAAASPVPPLSGKPAAGAEPAAAPPAPGLAHGAAIVGVSLSPDGKAAITRDAAGSARFWPSLDGETEPLPLPVRGILDASLAPREDGGFTLGIVDASGSVRLFDASRRGVTSSLWVSPPEPRHIAVRVLRGGEGVVTLARDHALVLRKRDGTEIARHEERMFRPVRLEASADGGGLATLEVESKNAGRLKGTLRRFRVGESIEPVGEAVSFADAFQIDQSMAFSPTLARFAFLTQKSHKTKGTQYVAVVKDLTRGTSVEVSLPMPLHLVPHFGFLDEDGLLAVHQTGGATAWLVDLAGNEPTAIARPDPPADVSGQPALATAGGRRVSGFGPWLFVQDPRSGKARYLGYEILQPNMTALSPDGRTVAWVGVDGRLSIEKVGGARGPRTIHSGEAVAFSRAAFLDDGTVAVGDSVGGIHVYDVRSGTLAAHADAGGFLMAMDTDGRRGLLRTLNQQLESRIFEWTGSSLQGPYVAADMSSRAGLLAGGTDGDPVLWTLSHDNKYRTYTLAELRQGVPSHIVDRRGETLEPQGGEALWTVDRQQRRYLVKLEGARARLIVQDGESRREVRLPGNQVLMVEPSPDGRRVLVSLQPGIVAVYDVAGLEKLWSFNRQNHTHASWSADGARVAIASQTGGVVLDGRTGAVLSRRCAGAFQVRQAPPPTHTFFVQGSACED